MNIRKFIAPTARQALMDIRKELGDEAVILSNQGVEGGVEMLALAKGEINRKLLDTAQRKDERDHTRNIQPQQPSTRAFETEVLNEIKSMQALLREQFAALSQKDVRQKNSRSANLMCKLLNAGFSAQLAGRLLSNIPVGNMQGEMWIKNVLKRNLRVASETEDMIAKGGVYALIGPTGVGKTTSTAKLAARGVVRYGADKVALLTTDSYRIGAHEQLKIYGKILGVAVHTVNGTEDLRLMISSLRDKRLVLIDTMGMGQRDDRVNEQRKMFDAVNVPRVLLLNAASSGETLEDVVSKYYHSGVIGCIPTKLDEAVNLGALLDVVARHRLVMHYITNGQCVPEDLHTVNLDYLLHRTFKPTQRKSSFSFHEEVLPLSAPRLRDAHSGMAHLAHAGLSRADVAHAR